MAMRILIINQYAGSNVHGMEYRPFYMARESTALGHSVTIVAGSFSHARVKSPDMAGSLKEEFIDGIRFVWLKTPRYSCNGIARALNIFMFVLQVFRFTRRILQSSRPDVVVASSTHPLDIFPARWIAERTGAKLVFEVHDLWPLSPIELGGMAPSHPFIRLIDFSERYAYRHADQVVSMLPNAEPYMISRGLGEGKFAYVPNGVNLDDWESHQAELPPLHAEAIQRARSRASLLVGYTGAHGTANALPSLIDAAEELQEERVVFVLVGQGPEKEALRQSAAKRGLNNVVFLPPVSRHCMPELLASMDVLYIGLKSQPLFRYGVSPNKLFDYMMAAKPVIQAIVAGNDMVSDCGCGYSVAPEDPQALTQAILGLLAMSQTERDAMGIRGRLHVMANHDYRVLGRNFIQALSLPDGYEPSLQFASVLAETEGGVDANETCLD